MISAWWLIPIIIVSAILGYTIACFMFLSGDDKRNETDKN